jgi:uncharacterized membrane protein YphA (DoxX/SURF4 family)/broad specificity phosphatase PhoE
MAPRVQSLLRIVAALTFITHGTQKLLAFPALQPRDPVPLLSQLGVAGVLESVGGSLLLLGLFTRPVAFLLSGEMAVAYFTAHAPRSFWPILNGGEVAVLFCFLWLFFAAAGPGPWSLDALRGGGGSRKRLLVVLATGTLLLPGPVRASEPLWDGLKEGRQVVLIRHAITTPGVGDPPGMRLEDCSTQRNLTDAGRRDAQRLGEAFRARTIPVDRVLSSPWCRCLETARLAFGRAEPWAPLSNLFDRSENRAEQVRQMQALVGERRTGGNLVLVSHGSTISALTGVSPGTAEMVIVTPQGGGTFTVTGRLRVPIP